MEEVAMLRATLRDGSDLYHQARVACLAEQRVQLGQMDGRGREADDVARATLAQISQGTKGIQKEVWQAELVLVTCRHQVA
jgi:hypothetical protein